jgi:hypothetical protein
MPLAETNLLVKRRSRVQPRRAARQGRLGTFPCRPERCSRRGDVRPTGFANANDHLAEILTVEDLRQSVGCLLEPVDDGLVVVQLAGGDEFAEVGTRLRDAVKMIQHEEAVQARSLHNELDDVVLANCAKLIVGGDHATQHDARSDLEAQEDGVHDLATDVLEVEVDPVRRGCGEVLAPGLGVSIDAVVEAERVDDVATLLAASGDTHHGRASRLRELAGDRSDSPGGGGNDDGIARAGLTDVYADIGREPCVPEDTGEGRGRGG